MTDGLGALPQWTTTTTTTTTIAGKIKGSRKAPFNKGIQILRGRIRKMKGSRDQWLVLFLCFSLLPSVKGSRLETRRRPRASRYVFGRASMAMEAAVLVLIHRSLGRFGQLAIPLGWPARHPPCTLVCFDARSSPLSEGELMSG